MRQGLRVMGAMAMALVAPHGSWGQSPAFAPPPPGTPVAPLDVPAHVVPPDIDRAHKPVERRFLNTTNIQLDYRCAAVGPSGIGKVEIYATTDRGNSWAKLGEDTDKQSPAHVQLPGEGLFGIRVAITNGNGFGGGMPRAGERPQVYVEVDTTAPSVVWQPHDIVPSLGAIDLRWTANDANLAPAPASLFYRTRPTQKWQPISQNIKNVGVYRWILPLEIDLPIYVKLQMSDLAGNTTTVEKPTPIVIDRSELKATLVDATPRIPLPVIFEGPTSIPPAAAAPPMLPAGLLPTSIPLPIPASLPTLPPVPAPRLE